MGERYNVATKNTGGTSGIANTAMGEHAAKATATDVKTGKETVEYGHTHQEAREKLNATLGEKHKR